MFDRLKKKLGLVGKPANAPIDLDGAYRRHRPEDVERFTTMAAEAFPEFAARITCFGADWLGTQFATDTARTVDGKPQVLMLEAGKGEVLEIPTDETAFHDKELANSADAAVALSFYKAWRATGGAQPGYDQCVGYRKPLFLGGADEVSNLELGDFEVYWSVMAQLLAKTRGLPVGTRIGSVSISDD